MKKVLVASLAAAAMLAVSMTIAAPASAQPLQKFCWNHPYAPICFELFHHHHHHHDDFWWYY